MVWANSCRVFFSGDNLLQEYVVNNHENKVGDLHWDTHISSFTNQQIRFLVMLPTCYRPSKLSLPPLVSVLEPVAREKRMNTLLKNSCFILRVYPPDGGRFQPLSRWIVENVQIPFFLHGPFKAAVYLTLLSGNGTQAKDCKQVAGKKVIGPTCTVLCMWKVALWC